MSLIHFHPSPSMKKKFYRRLLTFGLKFKKKSRYAKSGGKILFADLENSYHLNQLE